MDKWILCVVALILGMLMANMLKSVCGCRDVVEGAQDTCSDDGTTCCLKTKHGKSVVGKDGMKKCGQSGMGNICTCAGSQGWFTKGSGTCILGKKTKESGYVCQYDANSYDKLEINDKVVVDEAIGI